jgi:hypothetical protein
MKKIYLLLLLACFIMPAFVSAQYSNASLNGTWIADGDGLTFISFDGNGTVIMLGTSDDSLSPVGTYSVSSLGVIQATLHFVSGTQNVTGQMFNDSSASVRDTSSTKPPIYLFKVKDLAALAGTWNAAVYDSGTNHTRNIQLTVNNTGIVTAATGIPLVAGYLYGGRDTFATYITTTDDSCSFKYLQFGGRQAGDSLLGTGGLGSHNGPCQSQGTIALAKVVLGIVDIPSIDFSVYPNPFTDQMEISVNNTGGNIQADLYDLCGRKVLSQPLGISHHTNLDADTLSRGMYMLVLTRTDGKTSAKKVIKN